jgi:hypothetical protein
MAKRRRSQEPTRTVIRRTIIREVPAVEESPQQNWFRKNPVWAILLGVLVLVLLFAPLFTTTKTVQTTETITVPVATEEAVPATGSQTIRTYTGFLCDNRGVFTTIDAVAGIVDIRRVRGPGNTWVISTVDYSGNEVIYRDIVQDDLTKTGTTTIPATGAGTRTVTRQVPQQVTKENQIQVRVSFFGLLFGSH